MSNFSAYTGDGWAVCGCATGHLSKHSDLHAQLCAHIPVHTTACCTCVSSWNSTFLFSALGLLFRFPGKMGSGGGTSVSPPPALLPCVESLPPSSHESQQWIPPWSCVGESQPITGLEDSILYQLFLALVCPTPLPHLMSKGSGGERGG